MGVGRLSLSAAGLSAASGILLAIFEVQEWKMPDELAAVLVALVAIGGIIFLAVVLYEIAKLLATTIRRWGFRWPIYDKNAPSPHQWLLEIAQEHESNPAERLLITGQVITDSNLSPDEERPWIQLGFTLYNAGVHGITVGPVSGHAHFNGKELLEPIQAAEGLSTKPRGHVHEYKVKQYLSPGQAADMFSELQQTQAVRSLGVSSVWLEVRAVIPDAQPVRKSLDTNSVFRLRD